MIVTHQAQQQLVDAIVNKNTQTAAQICVSDEDPENISPPEMATFWGFLNLTDLTWLKRFPRLLSPSSTALPPQAFHGILSRVSSPTVPHATTLKMSWSPLGWYFYLKDCFLSQKGCVIGEKNKKDCVCVLKAYV